MLTASQSSAIAIGLVVFFGMIIPGITRYVLLGGTALLFVLAVVLGGGAGFLPDFLR
jgi:hypothetical protein